MKIESSGIHLTPKGAENQAGCKRTRSVRLLLLKKAMKLILLAFLICFSPKTLLSSVIPPLFQPTQTFQLLGEESPQLHETAVEHLTFGENLPALFVLAGENRVFLMGPPEVDRCGLIHFKGQAVELKLTQGHRDQEVRFYELSDSIDVTCHPIPFPRCGTFRSTEFTTVGNFLWDQLALLHSECRAFVSDGKELAKSYQIRLPSPSSR
ncbi:hypothetical protein EBR03_08835 [bacterium]|nr:hypothetical protein [bacterium]